MPPSPYDLGVIAAAHANPHVGRPLTIGALELRTNLLLAPVAQYCDLAWRIVCREQGGVGLACTDLLSPHGLIRGTAKSLDLAATNDADSPLCMQLYGDDPDVLAEGAVWAVRHGADAIDINMGCPVDKVTKRNGGSLLLCRPDSTVRLAERVVMGVARASRDAVPVTAKLRLGWDESRIVAPDLARRLERVGIQMVTVHGRTTEMRFRGECRVDGIRDVVEAVDSIPVLGNGDVTEPEHALDMMHATGCHGVMIGRGSFAAPWIFRRAWALQTTGDPGPEPTEAEKLGVIRRYFSLMLGHRDERYALHHIRRRISWFGKRLGACKPLKRIVQDARDPAMVFDALERFLDGELRVSHERIVGGGVGVAS